MAAPLRISAKLTLDTSDFRKGAAEADQIGDQLVQKERRRNSLYDEAYTARVRSKTTAETQGGAVEQAASEKAAARLAAQEARQQAAAQRQAERDAAAVARSERLTAQQAAKTEAAAKRQEEKEAGAAARSAKLAAEQEARDQAAAKKREERQQAESTRSAERATKQAADAQRAAQQAADKESRNAANRAGQLQFQFNDIFTSLGSGQSPLTVAIQQGPQITQLFGGLANTIAAIPRGFLIAGAAAAGFFALFGSGMAAAAASAERQRQFNIELQATGNIASVTAERLDALVTLEARRAGGDRAETRAALSTFISNPNLDSEQNLSRALGLARDLARVQGQELPAAAADFNRSMDGTLAAARRLDQAYNLLTSSELEQIRVLEEQGKRREVVNIVLEATERRFKGLNEQGISPTTKYLKELGNAWTDFADKVGKAQITQGMMWGGTQVLKGAAMLFGGPPPLPGQASPNGNSGLTQDVVNEERASLNDAESRLAELRQKAKQAIKPLTIDADIKTAEKRVAELRANVASLENDLRNAGTATAAKQTATADAEIERQKKEYLDLLNGAKTVEGTRRELINQRRRVVEGMSLRDLSPSALAQSEQLLQTIDGQLSQLATQSEKLTRDLDLETRIARLPQHLQAAERAWVQMYKSAKDAGETEDNARRMADQARSNAQQQQATATQEQIALLGAEARAALEVATAYGKSRADGLKAAAIGAARSAEEQGQIAPGTAGAVAQETLEKNAAATVAAAAEKNRAYEEEIAGLGRLASAEKVSSEAAREAERVNRVGALAIELRAQAEASGSAAIVAAAEQQIETYDRLSRQQLELERRRAATQFNAQFDPDAAYSQQMAQLQDLQATGEISARAAAEASRQYEMQRLQASRDSTDGMIAGLRQYADEATNAGRAASEGMMTGMRSLEDFAVKAVTTMKFSVTDFVNSALADFARLAVRQAITGPLASAASSALGNLGGLFSGLFGGGGSSPAATSTGGYGLSVPSVSTGYMHTGGIVGGVASSNAVPATAWIGARRYHRGGLVLGADEIPIIAKRREEVLTEDDPRHSFNLGRGGAGGGMGGITFKLINQGDPLQAKKGNSGPDGQGGWQEEIIFQMFDQYMADEADRGNGKFLGVLMGGYGVQPQGRR